ncbi:MAG TPA: phosphodiester glycosidase family protein, partial [Bacilli bacterium]|nr:phosphodiester glycosidase family protein [Bacilli bacterium]
KVTSKNPTYTAYKNGTYEFTVYDTNNNSEVYEVSISTLDTTPPILTCSGEIKDGKTHIVIDANEKISYYLFENVKSSKNDKIYEEEKEKVVVYGYDMSNNAGSVTCQVGENFYYDDISPTISHNILYTDESDSLKVQVLDTKYGVMSYIWVAKPYEQFKKATSNWGVNTLSPYNIMQNEISTNNLQSKIIIAINASGFYKQGAWVPSCSNTSYLPKYYNTTEGPLVITNGQVIRNWYYDDAIDRSRNHSIYGINPKGKLMAYPKINSYTEEARMKLFQEIIDSGIKNTFCFRPTIITNGEISSDYATSNFMKDGSKRQIMCQINTNNFVFITNYKSTTNSDRISLLKSVGCQTVINMDGGGSLATLFKQKNGDLKVIYGGSRAIVDVAYFTEL